MRRRSAGFLSFSAAAAKLPTTRSISPWVFPGSRKSGKRWRRASRCCWSTRETIRLCALLRRSWIRGLKFASVAPQCNVPPAILLNRKFAKPPKIQPVRVPVHLALATGKRKLASTHVLDVSRLGRIGDGVGNRFSELPFCRISVHCLAYGSVRRGLHSDLHGNIEVSCHGKLRRQT